MVLTWIVGRRGYLQRRTAVCLYWWAIGRIVCKAWGRDDDSFEVVDGDDGTELSNFSDG